MMNKNKVVNIIAEALKNKGLTFKNDIEAVLMGELAKNDNKGFNLIETLGDGLDESIRTELPEMIVNMLVNTDTITTMKQLKQAKTIFSSEEFIMELYNEINGDEFKFCWGRIDGGDVTLTIINTTTGAFFTVNKVLPLLEKVNSILDIMMNTKIAPNKRTNLTFKHNKAVLDGIKFVNKEIEDTISVSKIDLVSIISGYSSFLESVLLESTNNEDEEDICDLIYDFKIVEEDELETAIKNSSPILEKLKGNTPVVLESNRSCDEQVSIIPLSNNKSLIDAIKKTRDKITSNEDKDKVSKTLKELKNNNRPINRKSSLFEEEIDDIKSEIHEIYKLFNKEIPITGDCNLDNNKAYGVYTFTKENIDKLDDFFENVYKVMIPDCNDKLLDVMKNAIIDNGEVKIELLQPQSDDNIDDVEDNDIDDDDNFDEV